MVPARDSGRIARATGGLQAGGTGHETLQPRRHPGGCHPRTPRRAGFGPGGKHSGPHRYFRAEHDRFRGRPPDGRWPVSTARRGYRTPIGTFRPGRMYKRYFSKKYHGSPMPHSVFFYGGYAIHGTNAIRSLGRPASHGCIRLHPENARRLFSMIKRHGKRNARIVITR